MSNRMLTPLRASERDFLPSQHLQRLNRPSSKRKRKPEKYDILSLKLLARWKFEVALACWYDSNEIPDVIEDVYCGTIDSDRGLRDVVIQALQCQPTMAYRKDVKALLPEVPQFAEELWRVQSCLPVYRLSSDRKREFGAGDKCSNGL
ncbi:hypothetical protein LTR66_005571 [Elasticomyces elasticus]|nr:hypothetical protein LTR66_005571 [Elasticomyces elasticus]